jgi:hypothetical protein
MVQVDDHLRRGAHTMAQDPRCPKCHTMVQPSWDWCMGCGYDPASRKPADWVAAPTGATIDLSTGATGPGSATGPGGSAGSDRRSGAAWSAPAPPGAIRPLTQGTRVTTLIGPDAARPQEMRDPDWAQAPAHRKLPIPALIGLLAVVAAAIGALVVVTLLVLHRPVGTTGGGALQDRPIVQQHQGATG